MVSKSQLLRVLELYGVSMLIIIVSWVIYSIFGTKSEEEKADASHDPYAELAEKADQERLREAQSSRRRQEHHQEHSNRRKTTE